MKKYAVMAALMLVLVPAAAKADWLFTPNYGVSFGGDSTNNHPSYGASFGWMGAGVFGWEADLAYTPDFFRLSEGDPFNIDSENNAVTWMANVILGVPVGGQRGGGFRPYFSGGAGVLQTHVEDPNSAFTINNSEFGVNVGVGAFGFATDHIGFRGDVRYFRALTDPTEDNEFDIDFGNFNFWRGTVGVSFRW